MIPIHSVGKFFYNQGKYRRDNTTFELEITTRDYRFLRFRFGLQDKQSSYTYTPDKIQNMLNLLAFPPEPIHLFAFQHSRRHPMLAALKTQKKEKQELIKLRKMKEKDLIKNELKQKRKQMEKANRPNSHRSNSIGFKKPKKRKSKKSKSRSKRNNQLQDTNSNPAPVALASPV